MPSKAGPSPKREPPAAAPANRTATAADSSQGVLMAGQREWLEALEPELRTKFESLGAGVRADMLKAHAHGLNRPIDAMQRRDLAKLRVAEPPAPMPATTRSLLLELPRGERFWVEATARALTIDFKKPKDAELWGQFVLIAMAVWKGRLAVEPVVKAYDQAMRKGIENRGAKFWKALQCLAGIKAADLPGLAQWG